ncbi:hypothetical protein Ocin01_16006, partial [Orchesella cincta]
VFITLLQHAASHGESASAPIETISQNSSTVEMPMIQAPVDQMPAYTATEEISTSKREVETENITLEAESIDPEKKRVDRDYLTVELPIVHYRPISEEEARMNKSPPSIDDDRRKGILTAIPHGESSAELEDDLIKILLYHQHERQLASLNKTGKLGEKNGTKTSLDYSHKQPPPLNKQQLEQIVEKYSYQIPQESKYSKDYSPYKSAKSDYPSNMNYANDGTYSSRPPFKHSPHDYSDKNYANDDTFSSRSSYKHSPQEYSKYPEHEEYSSSQRKPLDYPEPRHLEDHILASDTKAWKDSDYSRSQRAPQNHSDTNHNKEYSHSQPSTSSNYSKSFKAYPPSQPAKSDSKYYSRPSPTTSNYSDTKRYKETSRTNSYSPPRSEPSKFSKPSSPTSSLKNKAPENHSYSKPLSSSSRPTNGSKNSSHSQQRYSTTSPPPLSPPTTKAPTCHYCGNERDCPIDETVVQVTTCPKDYDFDFWNGRCVPKDTLGLCNGFCLKNGKSYEDFEDRYGYHRCEDGLVKKFKCSPDVKFDPLHRTCLPDYTTQPQHQ